MDDLGGKTQFLEIPIYIYIEVELHILINSYFLSIQWSWKTLWNQGISRFLLGGCNAEKLTVVTRIILHIFLTLPGYQTTNHQKMQVHRQCWETIFSASWGTICCWSKWAPVSLLSWWQVKFFWSTCQFLHDLSNFFWSWDDDPRQQKQTSFHVKCWQRWANEA